MTAVGRHATVVITWLVAWPLVTVIIGLVDPLLDGVRLPVRTLVLTAILVPLTSYVAMPGMLSLIAAGRTMPRRQWHRRASAKPAD